MGRWRLEEGKARSFGAGLASISNDGSSWKLRKEKGIEAYESSDPDTNRIWWNDTGVHQNLTFAVQPDPVSGSAGINGYALALHSRATNTAM